ncbi:unnamed protein product [Effrenium voratum]|nr:unnamed protein product [Effrenium voratum]
MAFWERCKSLFPWLAGVLSLFFWRRLFPSLEADEGSPTSPEPEPLPDTPPVTAPALKRGFLNSKARAERPRKASPRHVEGDADETTAREAIVKEQEAGVRHFHGCAFRKARASFERMRVLASEAQLGREEGQACRLLGNALDKLNAPESEIEAAYRAAMRLAHQNDDMELSFNVLTGMGSHAVKTSDLELAEHLYLQSLSLAKRVLSQHEQGIAEGNLGMCLGQMEGRREESLEHFRLALKLQENASNPHSMVTLLANFASALCGAGNFEEARKEYERALSLARQIGDRRVEENILTNLSNLCENMDLPDAARRYRTALKGGSEAKELCAICLEPLDEAGRPQIVLQCNHMYHRTCFQGVLSSTSESRGKCPQCRNSWFSFAAA